MKIHQPISRAIGASLLVLGVLGASEAEAQTAQPQVKPCSPHARRLLERRANKGDVRAQLELGNNYFTGECGVKDKTLSAKWMRKAIEQQEVKKQKVDGLALFNMGILYLTGDGLPQSEVVAYALITLSTRSLKGESFFEKAVDIQEGVEQKLSTSQKIDGQILLRQMDQENSIFTPIDRYLPIPPPLTEDTVQ